MGDAGHLQLCHSGCMCDDLCKNTHRPAAPKAAHLPARSQGDKEAIIEPGAPELMAAGEKLASAPESGRECSSHATIQPTQGDTHNLNALPDCRRISSGLRNAGVGQFGPVFLPVIRPQIPSGNDAVRRTLNIDASGNRHRADQLRPLPHQLRLRTHCKSQLGLAAMFGEVFRELHTRIISDALK